MTIKTYFFLLTILLFTAAGWVSPLVARDSTHLVCVGRVRLGDASFKDSVKFALTYDDQRGGPGGDKRQIWAAMSLSAGNRIGVGEDLVDSTTPFAKVTLRNYEDRSDVLFRGTVRFIGDGEHVLVDGDFITNDKKSHHLHIKLECYEVPGIFFGQNVEPSR